MASVVNPSAAINGPARARGDQTTKAGELGRKIVDLIEREPELHPVSESSEASLSVGPEQGSANRRNSSVDNTWNAYLGRESQGKNQHFF